MPTLAVSGFLFSNTHSSVPHTSFGDCFFCPFVYSFWRIAQFHTLHLSLLCLSMPAHLCLLSDCIRYPCVSFFLFFTFSESSASLKWLTRVSLHERLLSSYESETWSWKYLMVWAMLANLGGSARLISNFSFLFENDFESFFLEESNVLLQKSRLFQSWYLCSLYLFAEWITELLLLSMSKQTSCTFPTRCIYSTTIEDAYWELADLPCFGHQAEVQSAHRWTADVRSHSVSGSSIQPVQRHGGDYRAGPTAEQQRFVEQPRKYKAHVHQC